VDKTPPHPGEAVLEVADLVVEDGLGVERVKGISFAVRRGEIVGIAGVAGNGQSELLETLAGIRPAKSGQIRWRGTARPPPLAPADALARALPRAGGPPADGARHPLLGAGERDPRIPGREDLQRPVPPPR